jgi:hypothetical protein
MGAGSVFLGGELKRVRASASGDVYLEKLGREQRGLLARLPSTRGKGGLSRRLVWAIAELAGHNPRQWMRQGTKLITWGGYKFDMLLAAVLRKYSTRAKMKANDLGLDGLPQNVLINPKRLAELVDEAWRKKDIPVSEASQFCQPSLYLSQLGEVLRRTEALNSVPFEPTLSWLSECDPEVREDAP